MSAPAAPAAPAAGPVRYAVTQPICAKPADPTLFRCYALKRVPAAKGTRGAYAYRPSAVQRGPAGGYTPRDLADAYGFDPDVDRRSHTVAVVNWYDDPYALRDLNAFDTHYGLSHETTRSFRKVNQRGRTSSLPQANVSAAGEISLDVQVVRAVCHTCRILLVEADGPTDADLAAAENRAAAMGATEISNSFGTPERAMPAAVRAAFNHPGVVITASTGDDGWFGWDLGNAVDGYSDEAAPFPSSTGTVVAVGGTRLTLTSTRRRASETVWNGNGVDNVTGERRFAPQGASGGGCSRLYTARPAQARQPGYSRAGCAGRRLAADVSLLADPMTGFDVVDRYGTSEDWMTVGGTSLSAPIVAAMYALAGGSGGAAYPASSIYTQTRVHGYARFDVRSGGNGYCSDPSTQACSDHVRQASFLQTRNPNKLGGGLADCSFSRHGSETVPSTPGTECNATAGFDGPSGVGAPNSMRLFIHTNPAVTLAVPRVRAGRTAAFTVRTRETITGIRAQRYQFSWGDGRTNDRYTSADSLTLGHAYARAGHYVLRVVTTDTFGQQVIRTRSVSVAR